MQLFYNPDIRMLIIVENGKAMSMYLQADETPARKAEEVIKAYHENPANITTCDEIIQRVDDDPLPTEDGPKEETNSDDLNLNNGDYLAS